MTAAQKKQTTRMIKVVCPTCGYIVRLTRVWLDCGAPLCGQCAAAGEVVTMAAAIQARK